MAELQIGTDLVEYERTRFYLGGERMDLKLKAKKAVVFGGSQGIGRAVAESLVAEGCEVIITARDQERLNVVAKEINAVEGISCDLSKPGHAKSTLEKILTKWSSVDILVMNTGGPQKGSFEAITTEQWQNDFQNLWISLVEGVNAVLPQMKKNNFGRLIFVTSIAAKEPLNGLTTSNGLRAGISGLAKSLSIEAAPFGVTVNCLLPGYTDTDRLKELKLSEERVKQMVPAGRLGHPSELADLAAFLSSPRAGYITGQSIAVDGGVLRGW